MQEPAIQTVPAAHWSPRARGRAASRRGRRFRSTGRSLHHEHRELETRGFADRLPGMLERGACARVARGGRMAIAALALAALAGISPAPAAAHAAAASDEGGALPSAGCFAIVDVPAGLSRVDLESGGAARGYAVYVSAALERTRPAPVVIDLHGSGSHPAQELEISGMSAAAEERGLVVVLPEAVAPFPLGGHTWNVPFDQRYPDDVRFVGDVLDDIERRLCVDRSRVWVTGFSGGARLASRLACELAGRIAALAAVGGLRAPAGCARPVPVVAFHGAGDPVNPYAGGGPAYWGEGVDAAFGSWAREGSCTGEVRSSVAPGVERRTFESCAGGEVTLYRLEGAGHVWPGSSFPFPSGRFGPSTSAIDATATLLEFFERHPLPPRDPHRP
jgi:polyhydroxybutyrate depolymerase